MADTPNLGITEMVEAQASKFVTFNQAMLVLDALTQCVIVDRDLDTPPGSPADGSCYIPKVTATGDWAGHEDDIAHYVSGSGWYFYPPKEGWTCYAQDENIMLVYNGSAWAAL